MFEATHKIYDYFTTHNEIPNPIEQIVDFQLKQNIKKLDIEEEKDMNGKAQFKVLSQYPFILYKDLKTATFNRHKELLSQIKTPNQNCFDINNDYNNDFSTFKFCLRRAAFLGNYQVIEVDFLKKLLKWFCKIDLYFEGKSQEKKELDIKEENLQDFPIFVLGNYVEMIQKNAWVAYKILENINKDKEFLSQFKNSNQGKQFLNMLQIETTSVIDDFMKMISKEYRIKWRDMCKDATKQNNQNELYINVDKIKIFFAKNELMKTNKYELVKETFLSGADIIEKEEFVNYLWIKQLLYADSIDKEPYIKIDYQEEIDEIINKMKNFFLNKEKVQAFFIVTDGQQNPHVLSPQDKSILNEFTDEFKRNKTLEIDIQRLKKQINKGNDILNAEEEIKQKEGDQKKLATKVIIDFLKGKSCNTGNATETTAEFVFENKKGKNIYTDENIILEFMPPEYKWLYLIRISKLKEDKKGNCKFETQGLLGFYSIEDLREDILPKQLLMLLRKDISEFINKHHKNDEFSELIQQKEKANYQFMLRHGIDEYKTPIKKYFDEICNLIQDKDDKFHNLKKYYNFELNHLTNKINLMDKFSKLNPSDDNHFDYFILREIVDTFYSDYEYVLRFERNGLPYLDKNDKIDDFIKVFDNTTDKVDLLNTEIRFPESILAEMIFELVYNIRKHVLTVYSKDIKKDNFKNKLNIYLDFVEEDKIIYFKISNNYCERKEDYFKCIYNNNKLDGLNLINCILKKANIGRLKVKKTEADELKDKIINIYIPLKYINK